jgi:hypothetical protein
MQHTYVEYVALNPFTAIEQPSQGPDRRVNFDPKSAFQRMYGTHLIGNRADSANARDNVGNLRKVPPPQEGFK